MVVRNQWEKLYTNTGSLLLLFYSFFNTPAFFHFLWLCVRASTLNVLDYRWTAHMSRRKKTHYTVSTFNCIRNQINSNSQIAYMAITHESFSNWLLNTQFFSCSLTSDIGKIELRKPGKFVAFNVCFCN